MEKTPTSPAPEKEADKPKLSVPIILISAGLTLALVVWFYGFVPRYGSYDNLSLLVIPTYGFHLITTHFQLWIVSLAHHFSALCGVETVIQGTTILPVTGKWPPLSISRGCGNHIYALMPLLMISAAWAYVAKIRIWQKILLFLSAMPLAILGNALRLTSIFVIAENGDARWATGTWYDWSGLLIVYPLSLFLLLALHSLFLGRLPWKKKSVFVAG